MCANHVKKNVGLTTFVIGRPQQYSLKVMGNRRILYKKTNLTPLLLTVLTVLWSGTLVAQIANPQHTSVADKFDAGKIEAALGKAEKLMDNDKTKNDPEAYLWASMCYFELSHSEDAKVQDYYKNAFKDAQKYAVKAVSKDKEGDFIRENWDYIKKLKDESFELAVEQLEEGDYRKANYTFKQLNRIDPLDDNVLFLKGVMALRLNNQAEAERSISESMLNLNAKYRDLDYQPDPKSSSIVQKEIIYYLDQLINTEQLDSARKVVFSARLFFPLDDEVNKRYEDLVR